MPLPGDTHYSWAFSRVFPQSLQTEMGAGQAAHCLGTILDSFLLSPHPLWVSYQEKRKRDPILCLRLKWIEDIKDFHFISLKNRFLPVDSVCVSFQINSACSLNTGN